MHQCQALQHALAEHSIWLTTPLSLLAVCQAPWHRRLVELSSVVIIHITFKKLKSWGNTEKLAYLCLRPQCSRAVDGYRWKGHRPLGLYRYREHLHLTIFTHLDFIRLSGKCLGPLINTLTRKHADLFMSGTKSFNCGVDQQQSWDKVENGSHPEKCWIHPLLCGVLTSTVHLLTDKHHMLFWSQRRLEDFQACWWQLVVCLRWSCVHE